MTLSNDYKLKSSSSLMSSSATTIVSLLLPFLRYERAPTIRMPALANLDWGYSLLVFEFWVYSMELFNS